MRCRDRRWRLRAEIVGLHLLPFEQSLQQPPGGGIVAAELAHGFLRYLNRNSCTDEVLRHDGREAALGERPEGKP
jgi:hypothetical protein